jgi:hypothetical protein
MEGIELVEIRFTSGVSRERDNEPSGFLKGGMLLLYQNDVSSSRLPCCME